MNPRYSVVRTEGSTSSVNNEWDAILPAHRIRIKLIGMRFLGAKRPYLNVQTLKRMLSISPSCTA